MMMPMSSSLFLLPGIPTSVEKIKENKHKSQTESAGCLFISCVSLPAYMKYSSLSSFLSGAASWTTSGETVLHQAASLCHRTICHYLVEAGASLMKTDLLVGSVAFTVLHDSVKQKGNALLLCQCQIAFYSCRRTPDSCGSQWQNYIQTVFLPSLLDILSITDAGCKMEMSKSYLTMFQSQR